MEVAERGAEEMTKVANPLNIWNLNFDLAIEDQYFKGFEDSFCLFANLEEFVIWHMSLNKNRTLGNLLYIFFGTLQVQFVI